MPKNYYAVLRVSAQASQQEIDFAYRRLVKRVHPALTASPGEYARARELNEAWRVLSDPHRRKEYDEGLKHASHILTPVPAHTNRPGALASSDEAVLALELAPGAVRTRSRISTILLALAAFALLAINVLGMMGVVTFLRPAAASQIVREVVRGNPTATAVQSRFVPPTMVAVLRAVAAARLGRTACADGCVTPLAGCEIKGLVNADGQRRYYLPTDASYDNVTVDLAAGGLWFCREADAERNGWTRGSSSRPHPATLPPATPTQTPTPQATESPSDPTPTTKPTSTPIRPTPTPIHPSPTPTRTSAPRPAGFLYPAPRLSVPADGALYRCRRELMLEWQTVGTLADDQWYQVETKRLEGGDWFRVGEWVKSSGSILIPDRVGVGCEASWWPEAGDYQWRVLVIRGQIASHTILDYLSPASAPATITYRR